jgi:hypothetical protein
MRRFPPPSFFHWADPANLPSIRQHGLLSTKRLVSLAGLKGPERAALLSQYRPQRQRTAVAGTAIPSSFRPLSRVVRPRLASYWRAATFSISHAGRNCLRGTFAVGTVSNRHAISSHNFRPQSVTNPPGRMVRRETTAGFFDAVLRRDGPDPSF